MVEENLVMLSLDLDIPDFWENKVVRRFPDANFLIKNAHPLGDGFFSGLLQIDGLSFSEFKRYLKRNHPQISLDTFHSESNLCHYISPDKVLTNLLGRVHTVLSWPIPFIERGKRIKFILKDYDVENVMDPLDEMGIDIIKFSKVKMNFNLKDILTPKQKKILGPSLKYGYYRFPKKISLNNLSKKIGVSPSTLCVHLQKIESKLIGANGLDLFL